MKKEPQKESGNKNPSPSHYPISNYNRDDVGLDTINWSLKNKNLKIQQEMENFIQSLKKKYIGVAA